MNRKELVAAVADSTGMTQAVAAGAIEAVLDAVATGLAAGDTVAVPGFGTFEVRERVAGAGVQAGQGAARSGELRTRAAGSPRASHR